MVNYVAFLRGINVGGNKLVKMDDLKNAFVALGVTEVSTLLASGNVLFTTAKKDPAKISLEIEQQLKKSLGKDIGVLIRPIDELKALAAADPFKGIKVTPQTRLFVTFLPEPKAPPNGFKTMRATDRELCTALNLDDVTTDMMTILDKHFGKRITTRNWNTIMKIVKR